MSTETEIKIKIDDLDIFCSQLNALCPRVLSVRHFEDNLLLDFPGGLLRSRRCLVRIRHAEGMAFVTYKGPSKAESAFKTREELETKVENGAIALRIFEQLGMRVWFRYQKYRREFAVGEVHVAVDETPVGNYVELEGSEDAILELARKMHIAEAHFLRQSYYALYLEYCQKKAETPGHMIF